MDGTATQMLTDQDSVRDSVLQGYGLLPASTGEMPVLTEDRTRDALSNVVRLAASLCGVPYSVVNIITSNQQL